MGVSVTPEQFEQALKENKSFSIKSKNSIKSISLFAFVFIITVGLLRLTEKLPRPEVVGENSALWLFIGFPLSIIVAVYLSILIHESGHVIASKLNGFRVILFVVGPFMLVRSITGWRFQYSGLKNMQLAGFVYSVPTYDENLISRTRNLYLGGPLATGAQIIFFIGLRWLLSGLTITTVVDAWMAFSLYFGFIFLGFSAIPISLGDIKNDATRIRQLQKKDATTFYLINASKLAQQLIGGKRLRDIDEAYIINIQQTATQPQEVAYFHFVTYLQMLDKENVADAGQHLESALEIIQKNPLAAITSTILLEASFYLAFTQGEAIHSRSWFNLANKQFKKLGFLVTPQRVLRAEAAVLLAEGHGEAAIKQAKLGLSWLEKSYEFGSIEMEKGWFDRIIVQATALENQDLDKLKPTKLYQPKRGLASFTRSLVVTIISFVLISCGTMAILVFINDSGFRYQMTGTYYDIIGDEEAALMAYSSGIERAERKNAYNNLHRGEIYAARGLYEQAIADFDEAIAIRPDLYQPYMQRGIIFYDQGDFARAIDDYSQSLSLNPGLEDMIDLYFYRAAAYSYLDMYEFAANDYNHILSISDDPETQALVREYLEVIGE